MIVFATLPTHDVKYIIFIKSAIFLAVTSSSRSDDVTLLVYLSPCSFSCQLCTFSTFALFRLFTTAPFHHCTFATFALCNTCTLQHLHFATLALCNTCTLQHFLVSTVQGAGEQKKLLWAWLLLKFRILRSKWGKKWTLVGLGWGKNRST